MSEEWNHNQKVTHSCLLQPRSSADKSRKYQRGGEHFRALSPESETQGDKPSVPPSRVGDSRSVSCARPESEIEYSRSRSWMAEGGHVPVFC